MSLSTFLVYVAFLIGLGLALTAAFSAADNYGLWDRVKKNRATHRPRETSFPASISLVGPSERFAEALFSSRGSSFHQYSTLLPTHLFVWHHQDRADRAEKWLYQISVEIEQKFFGRDENRPSQNQRH